MSPPPRYGPGRRRKAKITLALGWAAGVLLAILLTLAGASLVWLSVDAGPQQLRALMLVGALTWPLGAALGPWLSAGRPLRLAPLLLALALTLGVAGSLLAPLRLGLEGELARGGLILAALLLSPLFAQLGIGWAARREGGA